MRILIVDDEEIVVYSYVRYLSKHGHQVSFATNILETKRLLKSEVYDAVVLDLSLPDGDTLQIIPYIRSLNNETIILIVSGYSDSKVMEEAIGLGAHRFLVKPLSMQKICANIIEILNETFIKDLTTKK